MRLEKIREMAGLSQRKLAKKLNLSATMISKYEKGTCYPSADVLMAMADLFNVSVDAILDRDAELLDLKTLSKDQRKVVDSVVNKLNDNSIAKVVGYIENIEE